MSVKSDSFIRKLRLLPTITLIFLVLVWSMPTVGLIITAFRPQDEAMNSGWWEALFNPFIQEWTLSAFETVINRDSMFDSLEREIDPVLLDCSLEDLRVS